MIGEDLDIYYFSLSFSSKVTILLPSPRHMLATCKVDNPLDIISYGSLLLTCGRDQDKKNHLI